MNLNEGTGFLLGIALIVACAGLLAGAFFLAIAHMIWWAVVVVAVAGALGFAAGYLLGLLP